MGSESGWAFLESATGRGGFEVRRRWGRGGYAITAAAETAAAAAGLIDLGVEVEMGIGLGFEESLPDRSLVPSPHPFTSLFLFHFSFFFKEISLFISQL